MISNKSSKLKFAFILLLITMLEISIIYSQEASSQSVVDWTEPTFSSSLELDIVKSGFQIPSGRTAAQDLLLTKLPQLIKDPILSLSVDSSKKLGDYVLQENITLAQITSTIQNGKRTPSVYSNESNSLKINHSIQLNDITSMLIKHSVPYTPEKPITKVASRIYTGIIIDARGSLPVQGEFVSSVGTPCLFPKIWNENMELLYEKNMVDNSIAKQYGIIQYHWSTDEQFYDSRVGSDPLRITAKKIFGINRTDPVISNKDALKILSVDENRELLRQGKVVILLDNNELIYPVSAPEKNQSYYVVYRDVSNFFYERKIPDVVITDTYKGIQISMQDIKFIADSSEILPEEKERLDAIYENLAQITKDNEFTILVEGHTASVGKPIGEINLSVERAKTIIDQLVMRGMNRNIFTYKGYGGTIPIGDNTTNEGRAMNRRVEINIIPKATYIQRN